MSKVLQIAQTFKKAVITYDDIRAETDKDESMRTLRKLVNANFQQTSNVAAKAVADTF